MTPTQFTLSLLLSTAALLPASTLFAQETAESAQDAPVEKSASDLRREAAIDSYQKGVAAFTGSIYKEAVYHFLQAYAQLPEATFLYNASKAQYSLAKTIQEAEYARELLDRAVVQKERPLKDATRVQADTLRANIDSRLLKLKGDAERAQWKETRTDWRAWTGAGSLLTGAALTGVAFFYSEPNAREGLDKIKDDAYSSEREYEKIKEEVERDQLQGQVLLYTGAGLAVLGAGLVTWDLLTIERTRRTMTPKVEVSFGLSSANLKVSF